MTEQTRRLTRALGLVLLIFMTASGARGGEIVSEPAGAQVSIEGDVTINGVTPLPVDKLPPGSYRLTVRGYRMPRTQGRLRRAMDGTLRSERLNSAGVGLLPPGAAHLRQKGERWRGSFMLIGGVVSATGWISNAGRISQLEDDLSVAQSLYDRAISQEEILASRLRLESVSQELDDTTEMRNLWALATGVQWVGSWLEAWILTPVPELVAQGDGSYRLDVGPATKGGALLRSAIVPGGGQRYLGQYGRANRFLVGVSGFAMGALFAHDEYLDRRRYQQEAQVQFLAADTPEDIDYWREQLENRYDATRDMELIQWTLTGLAGGIYIWNLLDAATLIQSTGTPNTFSWNVLPKPDGFTARVAWRIG